MSIETTPAAASATAQPSTGGAKASGHERGRSAAPAGFMAILAALDVPANDSAALPQGDTGTGAPAQGVVDPAAEVSVGSLPGTDVGQVALLAQTLQMVGAVQDATGVPTTSAAPAASTPVARGTRVAPLGVAGGSGADQVGAATAVPAADQKALPEGMAQIPPVATSLVANGRNGAAALSTLAAAANDERVAKEQARLLPATAPLATAAALPLPASAVPPAVYDKPASERSVFKSNGTEGVLAAFSGAPGAPNASSIPAPEPVSNADVAVGQQISYWISQDVQNAQMKLDGFGDEPVEVNIRMQGNEAHIAFRSDEAQTRAALEHAGDHLRDLLQKEGVTLAGVSVGTSASGESGTQERKPRQGVRQALVAIAPLEPEVSRVRPGAADSRAVDLFV